MHFLGAISILFISVMEGSSFVWANPVDENPDSLLKWIHRMPEPVLSSVVVSENLRRLEEITQSLIQQRQDLERRLQESEYEHSKVKKFFKCAIGMGLFFVGQGLIEKDIMSVASLDSFFLFLALSVLYLVEF